MPSQDKEELQSLATVKISTDISLIRMGKMAFRSYLVALRNKNKLGMSYNILVVREPPVKVLKSLIT